MAKQSPDELSSPEEDVEAVLTDQPTTREILEEILRLLLVLTEQLAPRTFTTPVVTTTWKQPQPNWYTSSGTSTTGSYH